MTRTHLAFAFLAVLGMAPIAVHAAGEPEKVTSDSGPGSAHDHGDDAAREDRRANHIEGHIAFLKAELAITPAQEAAWDKVADAMREDVKDYSDLGASMPEKDNPTAIDSLTHREAYAEKRYEGEKRFLAAFKPLYDSLSAEQKQSADDLFASRSSN